MSMHPRNEKPRVRGGAGIERKGSQEKADRAASLYGASGHLQCAHAAVDTALIELREYADATDTPAWEAVDAADLLDTVADLLAKAVQS